MLQLMAQAVPLALGEYPVMQIEQLLFEPHEVQLVMVQEMQVFELKTRNPVVQLRHVLEVSATAQLAMLLLTHYPNELGKNPEAQVAQN